MDRSQSRMSLIDRVFRAIVVGSSETALAVAIVLTLALAFLGILVLSFPSGSGLVSFYDDMVVSNRGESRLQVDRVDGNDASIAMLTGIQRRVRARAAHAIEWKTAQVGAQLGDRHIVQTFERSGAKISFDDANRLRLGEKSLVVVKRPERSRWRKGRNASLVLLGGSVRGTVVATDGRERPLDIVMVGGSTRILSTDGADAEFSFKVNEDQSTTLSVFSGRAEVTSGGETVMLEPDQSVTVEPMQAPGVIGRIVEAPTLAGPVAGHVERYGRIAPRLNFVWTAANDADAYRFVLARDPELLEIVHTERTPRTSFTHGNLESGAYYWQVQSLKGRSDGRASPIRRLDLVEDLDPPMLELTLPDELVDSHRLVISGVTEPGSEVFVGIEPIYVNVDGAFTYSLDLDSGLNMIVVEAVDAAGNSAYHSQYVSARSRAMETSR